MRAHGPISCCMQMAVWHIRDLLMCLIAMFLKLDWSLKDIGSQFMVQLQLNHSQNSDKHIFL